MEHLNLTTEAVEFLSKNCVKQDRKGVRLKIKNSGCAGFKYDWQYIDSADSNDYLHTLSQDHFLAIDSFTLAMLSGSTLEVTKTPFSKTLNIVNPMVTSACGCGESFAI
jgi:iron-sulfur cluster assembly accessory protein